MYKLKRILYFHIILIYFAFIYSQTHLTRTQTYAILTTTTTTTTTPNEDLDLEQLAEKDKKRIKEQYKEIAKRLFDLKGKPTDATNNVAYVPRAMLDEYIKLRDTAREIIPDDRDFYGKINIEDLDQPHEDFWGLVYNKFGNHDIRVDMGPSKPKSIIRAEYTHSAHVPLESEPTDVPPNIEPILPPLARTIQSQKQFISVHLKFNLSQEIYSQPTAADDLKKAELYLARDKLYDCESYNCDRKKAQLDEEGSQRQPVPRFQRLYVLQIFNYDQYGEPLTRIHSSQRIDTSESTPLVINIYPIIKSWLLKPENNFGIIIRITNDDEDYERAVRQRKSKKSRNMRDTQSNTNQTVQEFTNASASIENQYVPSDEEMVVAEHVRLKREFRFKSENEASWLRYQPTLIIYSKPDISKHHVKRHHNHQQAEEEEMMGDDPHAGTRETYANPSSTAQTNDENRPQATEPSQLTQTERSTYPSTSTHNSASRREHAPTTSGGGRRNQLRNQTNSRTQQQQQGVNSSQRSKGKNKKCSKKSMVINFDDVGWSSWIIAPHAYNANYCAGDCTWPLADLQNATNHAIIQAIYSSVGRVVPKSCCAPVKLGRMAILYQLDGIVQMRQYDDMIVEACGCL